MTGIEKLREFAHKMRFVGYAWAEGLADDLESIADQIEHPAPKVLDADEVEIRVGDTVWHEDGSELVVEGFGDEEDGETLVKVSDMSETSVGWSECRCLSLTHRTPVLAADDKPLREGETVYHVVDGRAWVVREVRENGAVVESVDGRSRGRYKADYLTHERPDSLERLAENMWDMAVACRTQKICYDAQEAAAQCVGEKTLGMVLDSLALRAKGLAERGK